MSDTIDLKVVFEGDPGLMNPYAIIAVSPEKYPDLNHRGTRQLIDWLTSTGAQKLISNYRVNGFQLFHPLGEGQTEGAPAESRPGEEAPDVAVSPLVGEQPR